jgi:predicted naringenin-chalcone synthase
MSYLSAIGIATPENKFDQSAIAEFMVRTMDAAADEARKIRTVFKMSGIANRYSVLDDYGKTEGFSFYPNSQDEPFPSTEKRMSVYKAHALPLSLAAINNLIATIPDFNIQTITHLVVVSCTGMYAPGLDIDLVKALNLEKTVDRTFINFMGCHAAFNGLKVADAFCSRYKNARVLIVCTELCSIHFQRKVTDDNILANALFGDGSAAMLVESSPSKKKRFSIEQFHNDLALHGEQHMAWEIGDHGFEMKLSAYVPDLIRTEIGSLTSALLKKIHVERSDIKYFALHPGGKRIVKAIAEELHLTEEDTRHAMTALNQYGNISSASIVFVLRFILDSLTSADRGELVLGTAFGPGLTLESMILKCEID